MKLDKYTKQAIARSIIADLPRINEIKLKEEIQAKLVKAMSRSCQNIYKKTPLALATKYNTHLGTGYNGREFIVGDADFEAVVAPYKEARAERERLEDKVRTAVESCSTRKQFIDRFPEFSKYAPPEDAKCATLPAVANLVSDLVKAGWKQTISKAVPT